MDNDRKKLTNTDTEQLATALLHTASNLYSNKKFNTEFKKWVQEGGAKKYDRETTASSPAN